MQDKRDLVIMDISTGEVLESLSSDDVRESFCYFRLTEDAIWIYDLSATEIKVLVWLVTKMSKRGKVRMYKDSRKGMSQTIGVGQRSIKDALASLCERELVRENGSKGFIVSPEAFSYFKTYAVPTMIKRFKNVDLNKEEY